MIEIYCDGGANVHTDKSGAWAFIVVENDENIFEDWGSTQPTTNGEMEVTALHRALLYASTKSVDATIYSDSQYCVKAYNEWSFKWRSNGWRKSNNKPIEHQHIWELIDKVRSPKIKVEWVKGHSDNKWNNAVDKLTHNRND